MAMALLFSPLMPSPAGAAISTVVRYSVFSHLTSSAHVKFALLNRLLGPRKTLGLVCQRGMLNACIWRPSGPPPSQIAGA